ncbi:MAG: MFS transporter, partial [Azospirillum brasilense]
MSKFSTHVLKIPDFRRLLFTRMCGLMALQAQAVIVGWQIYSLTHDPFMLGLTGLVEAVPAIACALFAGHVVDVGRPHRIYLICLGVLALNTLMLFLLAGGLLHAA